MDFYKASLKLHRRYGGKLEMKIKVPLKTRRDLSIAYTPGVAEPCRIIARNPELAYHYTIKSNLVAVITDSSAVLGLGDLGGVAGLPVMEGKCLLFKKFANIDAIPICLDTKDVDEIVSTIQHISPTFGGINLEDIAAPRCFEIERRLKKSLDIPVFHDDQHGTATVILAGLINSLKIVKKQIDKIRIVLSGAGAAGIATARLLIKYGAKNLILCDSHGAIYSGRPGMNSEKNLIAKITNPGKKSGALDEVIKGADVFIGISVGGIVNKSMIRRMSRDAIVFAMANPLPEIMPDLAKAAGARIVATGRSDFPNQINNVLAFPGIFRGVLDMRATKITDRMLIAAAVALTHAVKTPRENSIIPSVFTPGIALKVAKAVQKAYKVP